MTEPLAAAIARTLGCTPEEAEAIERDFGVLVPVFVERLKRARLEAVADAFSVAAAWHLDRVGAAERLRARERARARAALLRKAKRYAQKAAGDPARMREAEELRREAGRLPAGKPGRPPGREVEVLWPALALVWRRVRRRVPSGRESTFAKFVAKVHEALGLPRPAYDAPHENAETLNGSAEEREELHRRLAALHDLYRR